MRHSTMSKTGEDCDRRKSKTTPMPSKEHRNKKTIMRTCRDDDNGKPMIMYKKSSNGKTRRTCLSVEKESMLKSKVVQRHHNVAKKRMTRPKLDVKTSILSEKYTYTVIEMLGSGGFGDVYKVEQSDTNEVYALKTEQVAIGKSSMANERLKIETTVLHACNRVNDADKRSHFIKMIDKGVTERFKFIVMEIVGPSIDDIRRHVIQGEFSRTSAARLSLQALEGIADLHALGFLHRDVKPQNFCIGLAERESILFILDFGIARQFTARNGRDVRAARDHVKFLGTVRYASRTCHRAKEQSRKDDLETWIYMTVELFDSATIMWKKNVDRVAVLMEKEKFFSFQFPQVWNKVPLCYKQVMKMIDQIGYVDEPMYTVYKATVEIGCKESRIDLATPFEWVGKVKIMQSKKAQSAEKTPPLANDEDLQDDIVDEGKPVRKHGVSTASRADK